MSRTEIAAPNTYAEAAGMALAGLCAVAVALAVLPVTLVVVVVVRSQEAVPRLIQWGRRRVQGLRGTR